LVSFSLVPAQFRVLYVNLVTVVWDIFLSYIKHQSITTSNITARDKVLETGELFFR
jgi:Mpv17 / PMP22 family